MLGEQQGVVGRKATPGLRRGEEHRQPTRTVPGRALLEGGVVQARLLCPGGKGRRCQGRP